MEALQASALPLGYRALGNGYASTRREKQSVRRELPDCRAGEPLTALASSRVRKTRSDGGGRIVLLGAGLRYPTPVQECNICSPFGVVRIIGHTQKKERWIMAWYVPKNDRRHSWLSPELHCAKTHRSTTMNGLIRGWKIAASK